MAQLTNNVSADAVSVSGAPASRYDLEEVGHGCSLLVAKYEHCESSPVLMQQRFGPATWLLEMRGLEARIGIIQWAVRRRKVFEDKILSCSSWDCRSGC
jgi:hypothetical protein